MMLLKKPASRTTKTTKSIEASKPTTTSKASKTTSYQLKDCSTCNGEGQVDLELYPSGGQVIASDICPSCDGYQVEEQLRVFKQAA